MVRFPFLANIQGKHFSSSSYEGFRNHTGASNLYNTPTTAQLAGDLTGIAGQIYNPYSGQPFVCAANGTPLPAPGNIQGPGTPCNKIPSSMIDQDMVNYAKTIVSGAKPRGQPAIQWSGHDQDDYAPGRRQWTSWTTSSAQHDSVWARYTSFRQPVSGSGGFAGLLHDQVTDGYNVAVDYTHLFSGSMLADFHFGRTSVNIDQGTNVANAPPSFGTQVGFSPNFAGNFRGGAQMIPEVVIQGYIGNPNPSAHGAAQVDDTHVSNIWEYGGDLTKTFGRHTFKAGVNFASNNANALYLNSSVQFAAANTANPVDLSGGNAIASFLLGDPEQRRTPQCD